MVMQMAIFDKVISSGLDEVERMNGLERTIFINDIFIDYKTCKDLRQHKMEAFYLELLTQLIKDYGH